MHTQPRPRPRAVPALGCVLLACLALGACGGSQKSSGASSSARAGTGANQRASTSTSSTSASASGASLRAEEGAPPTGELSQRPDLAPSTVLASVQGQKVTLAEVRRRMGTMGVAKQEVPEPPEYSACMAHRAPGAPGKSRSELKRGCQGRYEELLRAALNLLIRARWLTLQAREYGLRVDEAAFEREFARALQAATEAGQTPASTGQSLAEAKFWARINAVSNLVYEEVTRQTPKVTPQRIAAYYKAHEASFAQPEQRDLRLIRTDSQASAKKVLGEIRSGQSFASVVRQVSTHQPIHAQDGLILGLTYKAYAEPVLADAIFTAKPYLLSGPIRLYAPNSPKIAFGYYIFEVTRIHPARQQSLAQVKSAIARSLPETLRLQTLKSYVASFRKKWRARSSCRAGFVVEDCRQYRRPQPFQDEYTL